MGTHISRSDDFEELAKVEGQTTKGKPFREDQRPAVESSSAMMR